MDNLSELTKKMNSFDLKERQLALGKLLESDRDILPESSNVNMHIHSFFSYNSSDYSPSRIAIDYEKDVLPLTPADAATERHIIKAYVNKAAKVFRDKNLLAKFWAEVLATFKETFLRWVRIFVGHSVLLRFADFSYVGKKSRCEFDDDIESKNNFFESADALPPVTAVIAERLKNFGAEKAFTSICDSAKQQNWIIK